MTLHPLLILDFDGVIIDGLLEYWSSSRKAYFVILGRENNIDQSNSNIPNTFRTLRPWVKNGWEMVLLAAEMLRKDSPISQNGPLYFAENYKENCLKALKIWGWDSEYLQIALDNIRKEAIITNKEKWLASHIAFKGVILKIQQLAYEEIDFGVLTTNNMQQALERSKNDDSNKGKEAMIAALEMHSVYNEINS